MPAAWPVVINLMQWQVLLGHKHANAAEQLRQGACTQSTVHAQVIGNCGVGGVDNAAPSVQCAGK